MENLTLIAAELVVRGVRFGLALRALKGIRRNGWQLIANQYFMLYENHKAPGIFSQKDAPQLVNCGAASPAARLTSFMMSLLFTSGCRDSELWKTKRRRA